LPASVAADTDRLARFTREAHTLAALNHPNIAAVYGLEGRNGRDEQDTPCLVMELIEGEDLSQRIARGAIPIAEALPIAKQIADALEAAHEQGIIHRDLKPANIKVRVDGLVKVLDFGLAKALDPPAASGINVTLSPTITSPGMTQAGIILGTAAYMSPEQASGKPVDKRSDLWSFGVVLFEMLTGRRLYDGETMSHVIAAVLTKEPDWSALSPATPAAIRRLLRRCLEKDRRKRIADAGDARLDIEEALNPQVTTGVGTTTTLAARPVVWMCVSAVLALALVALAWVQLREPRTTTRTVASRFHFTLAPPAGQPFPDVTGASMAPLISPDGQWVLIGTELRRLDDSTSQTLAVQNASGRNFWSPDSKWVAFPSVREQLVRVRVPDGTPETIGTLPGPERGGAWAANGAVLVTSYSTADQATLRVLLPGDAKFTPVKVSGVETRSIFLPEFLDGGPEFLFLARDPAGGEGGLYLATLQGGEVANPGLLMANATVAHYTPAGGGRLLFVRGDNLYAVRLDVRHRKLDGDPDLVLKGVATSPVYGLAAFSISRDGVLVWRRGTAAGAFVTTFDRAGRALGRSGQMSNPDWVRVSPDGTQAVVSGEDSGSVLLETGQTGSLSLGGRINPLWMPGGTRLLYEDVARKTLFEGPLARSGEVQTHPLPAEANGLEDVSADGLTALCVSDESGAVFAVRLDAGPQTRATRVVDAGAEVYGPRFSPDGRWVVYGERNGTQGDIFVQPFPGPGARRQIASIGRHVVWRGDGREILFTTVFEGQTWVTSVQVNGSGADLRFSEPERLFVVHPGPGVVLRSAPLAVSRDGSRIFYAQAVEPSEESNVIHVSTAWMK
jgi:serine/threonine protein kinase